MRITIRLVLCFAAAAAFAALPVYGQHGGGHAGGPGTSMGSSHPSTHTHGSSKSTSQSGTKISDQLADNTHLSNKLLSFFPTGTTLQQLQQEAQGFKNLGQFVAAVHVSHNLGLSFDALKAEMMGPPKKSLGQAIHALKSTANAKAETKKGQKQAKQDLNDSKAS